MSDPIVIDIERENEERRYLWVRSWAMPDLSGTDCWLIEAETWGGPDDGELNVVRISTIDAIKIFGDLEH